MFKWVCHTLATLAYLSHAQMSNLTTFLIILYGTKTINDVEIKFVVLLFHMEVILPFFCYCLNDRSMCHLQFYHSCN